MTTSKGPEQQTVESYDESLHHFHQLITHWVTRRLGPHHVAIDDITQQVLLDYSQKARTDRLDQPSAWMYSCMLNKIRMFMRTEKRRHHHEQHAGRAASMQNPDQDRAELHHMDAALDALPERERIALIDHFVLGHSYEDISKAQDVSIGTVGSRIHRGLKRMRRWYKRQGFSASLTSLAALLLLDKVHASEQPPCREQEAPSLHCATTAKRGSAVLMAAAVVSAGIYAVSDPNPMSSSTTSSLATQVTRTESMSKTLVNGDQDQAETSIATDDPPTTAEHHWVAVRARTVELSSDDGCHMYRLEIFAPVEHRRKSIWLAYLPADQSAKPEYTPIQAKTPIRLDWVYDLEVTSSYLKYQRPGVALYNPLAVSLEHDEAAGPASMGRRVRLVQKSTKDIAFPEYLHKLQDSSLDQALEAQNNAIASLEAAQAKMEEIVMETPWGKVQIQKPVSQLINTFIWVHDGKGERVKQGMRVQLRYSNNAKSFYAQNIYVGTTDAYAKKIEKIDEEENEKKHESEKSPAISN